MNDLTQDFESLLTIAGPPRRESLLKDILGEIKQGFEAPYVRMAVRRKLKCIISWYEHPESIFNEDHIPQNELVLRCQNIKNDMGEAFHKSSVKISAATRQKVIAVMDEIDPTTILPTVLSRLRHPRLATTVEIIRKVIPAEVSYFATFAPDGNTIVYIGQQNLVNEIKEQISSWMNSWNIRGCVDVAYAENGTYYSHEKLD